jgi:hypothetical protein
MSGTRPIAGRARTGGRIVLPAGLRLAPTNQNADPRPRLLGSLLLRGGIGSRRALRAPRRRFALGHAGLKKVWRPSWSPEDGASTVLPGAGGIHRVGNPGAQTAISVHLYGPRLGEVDGHDYNPSRDHVCDRVGA